MQLIPRYLLSNRTNLVADVAGFVTEFRPVYSRQLQVYKGIDNVLEFRILNAEQRAIDITAYTPKLIAFDENNNLLLEKEGTVLDDGSTTTRGIFTVTITENELLNVKQQYLKYNVFLVGDDNNRTLTYSHSNFDNDATIYVNARTFPGPQSTHSVEQFTQVNVTTEEWVSEAIYAQPGINGNEALHTAAVYTDAFSGDVIVQATLDNDVTESTQWADIATLSFNGSETEPTPVNFNGVFSYMRFKTTSNPAEKITKVLVRN
jgi:hypothetical protein